MTFFSFFLPQRSKDCLIKCEALEIVQREKHEEQLTYAEGAYSLNLEMSAINHYKIKTAALFVCKRR